MQEFAACKTIAQQMDLRPLNCLFRKYRMAVRIMKLTTFILLAACLQLSARGVSQTVTISVKDAPLVKVLKAIEKQTDFVFFMSSEELKRAKNVSITAKSLPLLQVLDLCFKDQPLTYTITGKLINVVPRIEQVGNGNKTSYTAPFSKNIDVSGKVIDENGGPAQGVNITVKETGKGTSTNYKGEFELHSVDENAYLIITSIGYNKLEVPVNGKTFVSLQLKVAVGNLDEMQIIAYGTTSKRFSTGNISTIKSSDIEKQPVQNPLLALQGRVPGIEITQQTGLPGGAVVVRIQGQNSLRQNALEPFIVIDGVPFSSQLFGSANMEGILQGGSPLNYVNPDDIESISVLKDADATAIYGSRAANGAILITTKKAKGGKVKLSVNLQQGWGKVTQHVNMMNTRQYLDMRYEAYKNDGIDYKTLAPGSTNYDLTLWDTTRDTDWQKTLIGKTAKYSHFNASVSGGNANSQYLIGASYSRQTDVFPGDFANKIGGFHFNVNSNSPNNKFRIQLTGSYSYTENNLPGIDYTQTAILMEPVAPNLYNDNGTLNWAPNAAGASTWTNPLASAISSNYNHNTKNLISNILLGYKILPSLEISTSFGYTNMQNEIYTASRIERAKPESRPNTQRIATFGNRNASNWIIEPQLTYTKHLGKGKLDGLLGATFQKNSSDFLQLQGSGYSNDQLMTSVYAAPTKTVLVGGGVLYKYNGFFGRASYNWDDKYIINLNARRDGSSRFGDANKFYNFASVGLGWIFVNENIVKRNLHFLSFGKLKGSYGTTGSDQIDDYLYISTYQAFNDPIPYQNLSNLTVTGIPNPHLQWEETKKIQGGIDLGFLNDRFLTSVTYARNRSSNQLIYYQLPDMTGFPGVFKNFPALIENTSWEFTLQTVNIKGKKIIWTSNFNLTIPKNKLIKFPGIEKTSYGTGNAGLIVGEQLGLVRVYRYAGVDPTTGKYLIFDTNNNPTADFNSLTTLQDYIVKPGSKLYGGINNSISIGSFQLDFLFQFVRRLGTKDLYYSNGGSRRPGTFSSGTSNEPTTILNRWQKIGDDAEFARYTTGTSFALWAPASDARYSYDASYIRLKNVSFSWHLPINLCKKAKIQNCLLYFNGQNLMTITKYTGLDPETASFTTLPPLRMWTVGMKAEF